MPLEADTIADAVKRWAGVLSCWLRTRTASPDDIVQETFCRLACLDKEPERMAAWLFSVALNLCREDIRRTKRRIQREQSRAAREAVAETAHRDVVHQEVREAIEKLTAEQRDLIVARLWGELTLQECAELLHLSTTTAHRRYQEALGQLRLLLSENEKARKGQ